MPFSESPPLPLQSVFTTFCFKTTARWIEILFNGNGAKQLCIPFLTKNLFYVNYTSCQIFKTNGSCQDPKTLFLLDQWCGFNHLCILKIITSTGPIHHAF